MSVNMVSCYGGTLYLSGDLQVLLSIEQCLLMIP